MKVPASMTRIVLLLGSFFFLICPAGADSEQAIVTSVLDGDTIRIRKSNGHSDTVRLIGINTPELSASRTAIKLQALLAKRYTYIHLYQQAVRLIFEPQKRDKYGRLLAFVFINGTLFNEKILKKGFASIYLKFPFRGDFRQRFERAYREAREKQVGLWKQEPYPKILLPDLSATVGTLGRVEFRCGEIEEKRGLVLLHSTGHKFAAVIFRRDLAAFHDVKRFKNKKICVYGLIEEYRGQPQVVIFQPQQILNNSGDIILNSPSKLGFTLGSGLHNFNNLKTPFVSR